MEKQGPSSYAKAFYVTGMVCMLIVTSLFVRRELMLSAPYSMAKQASSGDAESSIFSWDTAAAAFQQRKLLQTATTCPIECQGDRGSAGERGPRGWKGDRGDRGYCVALAAGQKPEEFKCPDQVDSLKVEKTYSDLQRMSRLQILQQVQAEMSIRNRGGSGVMKTRAYASGSAAYNDASFSNYGVCNVHDHANNKYTIGLGEFSAVLNGVEFTTRHNDYGLFMPHRTYKEDKATEPVPLPDVPPAVLAKATVAEQVTEMREWFKAFKTQDHSVRDYRPYFKPTLCYLEGAWITDDGALNEPFSSDRHKIDAATWEELHEKVRFLANNGRKHNLENLATLPSSIRGMGGPDKDVPVYANFEYRILCHPLKDDVPTNRFKLAKDIQLQLMFGPVTEAEMYGSRRARFDVNQVDLDTWHQGNIYEPALIDKWMAEVPGRDNYVGNLTDYSFGYLEQHSTKPETLNVAYYSRFYSINEKDAMGRSGRRRGFNDGNLWAARTTQAPVSALNVDDGYGAFVDPAQPYGPRRANVVEQKWTWAFPLEVIYTSPLTKWNPYNLDYKGEGTAADNVVTENGKRTGSLTDPALAYQGLSRKNFFMTPVDFFGVNQNNDAADTSGAAVGVLDKQGTLRQVRASGHWLFFPEILGVGNVRQRYPIMPLHEEGNTVWKEVKAMQDLMDGSIKKGPLQDETYGITFELTFFVDHSHYLSLSGEQIKHVRSSPTASVVVQSTLGSSHTHDCTIIYNPVTSTYVLKSMTFPENHKLARVTV